MSNPSRKFIIEMQAYDGLPDGSIDAEWVEMTPEREITSTEDAVRWLRKRAVKAKYRILIQTKIVEVKEVPKTVMQTVVE